MWASCTWIDAQIKVDLVDRIKQETCDDIRNHALSLPQTAISTNLLKSLKHLSILEYKTCKS